MAISSIGKKRGLSIAMAGILVLSIIVLVPIVLAATPGSDIPTLIKNLEQKLWSNSDSVKSDTELIPDAIDQLTDVEQKLWSGDESVKNDTKLIPAINDKIDDIPTDTVRIKADGGKYVAEYSMFTDTYDYVFLDYPSRPAGQFSTYFYVEGLDGDEYVRFAYDIGWVYANSTRIYEPEIHVDGLYKYEAVCMEALLLAHMTETDDGFTVYWNYVFLLPPWLP